MQEETSEKMAEATVPFATLCNMFDAVIRAKKGGPLKRKHVRTFLDRVYTGNEFYSVLRLMLPSLDKVRGNYGLKETVLGKFISDALCLATDAPDAQKLLNWRKGGTRAGSNAGNFAIIAGEILQRRQRVISAGLKIKDVNDLLDRLVAAAKREEKVAILREMIGKTNAQEMRWIVMIILKDLKLGISEKTILDEFHPDAQDMHNVTCDLHAVCEKLGNRNERFQKQDIQVGKAVKPQLAARTTDVNDAWKKLRGKEVIVECKFDGERVQIHKDGARVHFFSRAAIDHQAYKEGMADVIVQNVLPDKCILDGEMLTWDRSNNRFSEFGTNRGAAKAAREGSDTSEHLCYVVFDILYHGSSSVIHRPLRQRQELLYSAIRPVKNRLEVLRPTSGLNNNKADEPIWSAVAKSVEEVKRFFQRGVENRDEGIILKDLDSKWVPGDRSGTWLKLKPDYFKAGSDIDVLIIGGYFGSGRKGGQVAQFLLGIAEKPKTAAEYPSTFYSFCRVGTGLTDEQSDQLVQRLSPYFRRYEKNSRPPSCYIVTNHSKERPDVWVDSPEKSCIVEINSDIRTIDTEVFAAPYGLRFPRIAKVRYDKPWYDCLDVQTLVDTVTAGRGSTFDPMAPKKILKPKERRQKRASTKGLFSLVPSHMGTTDVSHVTHATHIFTGLTFFVANSPAEHSRESLHKLVVENGGSFFMNLTAAVTHVIASERKGINFQAAAARRDVIHYSWVIDCCAAKTLLPVSPKYYLHLSNQTKEKMKSEICEYGDQYFVNIDTVDLSQIFKNIDAAEVTTDREKLAHDKKKYCSSPAFCQFSDCHFYFHKPVHSANPDSKMVAEVALKRQQLEVGMHGGDISETLNSNVSHMIVYTSPEQVLPFRSIVKSVSSQDRKLLMSDKLKILSHQWIEDHKLGTCGHPEEAKYDLRDPSFQLHEDSMNRVASNENGNVKKKPKLEPKTEQTV